MLRVANMIAEHDPIIELAEELRSAALEAATELERAKMDSTPLLKFRRSLHAMPTREAIEASLAADLEVLVLEVYNRAQAMRRETAAATKAMTEPLHDSIMQRANDLTHVMLTRGIDIAVEHDKTANGIDCTVIMAIGDLAATVQDMGQMLVTEIARLTAERDAQQAKG